MPNERKTASKNKRGLSPRNVVWCARLCRFPWELKKTLSRQMSPKLGAAKTGAGGATSCRDVATHEPYETQTQPAGERERWGAGRSVGELQNSGEARSGAVGAEVRTR